MLKNGIEVERVNRFFKGEYSEEDRLYLNEVFCDGDKVKELEKHLSRQWNDLLSENDSKKDQLDHVLYRIHYEVNTKMQKSKQTISKFVKWFSRVAAVFVLPLLIYTGIHLYRFSIKEDLYWVELNTPAWTRAQFTLPDGTTGWLNSNSSLRYNGNYHFDRKVILQGEAFFDVFTDKKRPFVVDADEIIITATGTRFNVSSYEDENNVDVVLEEGKLIVDNKKKDKLIQISPNELLVYNKEQDSFTLDTVQTKKYISWTDGRLVFRNDPLDVIARRLGRWYNVDIELDDNIFKDIRLFATFEDENLQEVLFFLKRSLHIEYIIIDGDLQPNNDIYTRKKVIISAQNRLK